ncbi:MAG TPA: hypothetical protein VK962_00165 [Actinomycetota bacterium]|jgi:hypothetical protein|nr:hypothetical protein [Actinomycetota bacterium]
MSTHDPQPLRAVAMLSDARPNRTSASGRVCGYRSCGTRLSIYNRSSMCWLHESPRTYIVRGKRRGRGDLDRRIA